ncbi:hypothetical protein ABE354_03005 [Brevibacillus laterosporus]
MVGIPTVILRAWENRYAALSPNRIWLSNVLRN